MMHNAALVKTQDIECEGQSGVVRCYWESYCHHPFGFDAVCIEGFCQCTNSDVYDTCTCLRKSQLMMPLLYQQIPYCTKLYFP